MFQDRPFTMMLCLLMLLATTAFAFPHSQQIERFGSRTSSSSTTIHNQRFLPSLFLYIDSNDPSRPGFRGTSDQGIKNGGAVDGTVGPFGKHVQVDKTTVSSVKDYLNSFAKNSVIAGTAGGFSFLPNSAEQKISSPKFNQDIRTSATPDAVPGVVNEAAQSFPILDAAFLVTNSLGSCLHSFSNKKESVHHESSPSSDSTSDSPGHSVRTVVDAFFPHPHVVVPPSSTARTTTPYVTPRRHQATPQEHPSDSSRRLVVMNEASVEFTAGVVGGVAGLVLGGPLGAVAMATVANYMSRQEGDEMSRVVRSVSQTAIEVYNYVVKMDAKHNLMNKSKASLEGALQKLKQSEGGEVLDKVEHVVGGTVGQVVKMSEELDLWSDTMGILGVVGDIVEKTVHTVGKLGDEFKVFDRLANGMSQPAWNKPKIGRQAKTTLYSEK